MKIEINSLKEVKGIGSETIKKIYNHFKTKKIKYNKKIKIEENNFYLGDSLKLLSGIKNNSIDLIFTDPPYKMIPRGTKGGVGGMLNTKLASSGKIFKENNISFIQWLPQVYRVLKNESHCYIMVNWKNLNQLINVAEMVGFNLQNILVWHKNNCTPSRWYMKNLEFIVMFKKGKAKPINYEGSKALKKFKNVKNKIHPTQKPIKLIEYFILNSTKENQIVLDPFGGVFTTAIACKINNRKYINGKRF